MIVEIPDLIVERALESYYIQTEKTKNNIEVRSQLSERLEYLVWEHVLSIILRDALNGIKFINHNK